MSVLTTSVGVLTTTFVPKVTSCSSYYIQVSIFDIFLHTLA